MKIYIKTQTRTGINYSFKSICGASLIHTKKNSMIHNFHRLTQIDTLWVYYNVMCINIACVNITSFANFKINLKTMEEKKNVHCNLKFVFIYALLPIQSCLIFIFSRKEKKRWSFNSEDKTVNYYFESFIPSVSLINYIRRSWMWTLGVVDGMYGEIK